MAGIWANTKIGRARPAAIIAMLSAALVLIGVLGWQSIQLQKSNTATAESVLREYGILVADEYGRRSTAELGYGSYYQLVSRIANLSELQAMRAALAADDTLVEAGRLVAQLFFMRAGNLLMESPGLSPELDALLRSSAGELHGRDAPYHSLRTESGREQVIYAVRAAADGTSHIAGFVVSPAGIGEHLGRIFDGDPLLPSSLAGGQVSNDMLFLRVTDPAGAVVLERNRSFDSHLTVSKVLGAQYQGILDGFRIDVSLDPARAGSLVIGGLPESRLPFLLVVMIFVVTLMISAIWLFRREQAVMKLRAEFISQVSHELRTPLTQIRMFAETLLLGRARNDDDKRRSLEIIDRESRRLSHLVDNILRFADRSDPARIDRRPLRLAPIVDEVRDIVLATVDSATISTSVDAACRASIDADALRQVLLNLLDNALKYGTKGQTIEVSLTRGEGVVLLAVEDQGPGIPEAERSRVWSAFYRLRREEQTAISGTGIGLSVVRELVEAMDGRCWIAASDRGARVCVEFPEYVDVE